MSQNPAAQQVIASALALSAEDKLALMDAIHMSLTDPQLDHGPRGDASQIQDAWKSEIARRLSDIDEGRVETVKAEEAERMIREDAEPRV